jgi:hypothetical protein
MSAKAVFPNVSFGESAPDYCIHVIQSEAKDLNDSNKGQQYACTKVEMQLTP